jgi:DNA-binding NtrC family response regulator
MIVKPDPKILIVDDDVDICRNLTDILTDLDYRVDSAHDGPSALELVRRTHYDIALLDLRMPGMNGLELYREIKKLRAGTVAVLVTAYASGATVEEARAAGAWQVVSKPVDLVTLLALVDEALGQPLILIVDDDRDLCANLWDLLRDRGYRVNLAHGVREASEKLADSSFKVVLIDLKMPDGNGAEVFRQVRGANPQARTIVITGHRPEMDGMVASVLAEGADAVCYKPFDVPRLLEALRSLARPGGELLESRPGAPPE